VDIVAAIDIDSRKVGRDLSEAIFTSPNVAQKFLDVPKMRITVAKGPIMDGADGVLKDLIQVDGSKEVDVVGHFKKAGAEVVVCLLPTGCQKATEYYASCAAKAGCAFVNCTPAKIVSDAHWAETFEGKALPLAGDDLMSQIGGTVFHMGLLDLLKRRGVTIGKTYQLDIGGSMEAFGVLADFRRESKRKVKSDAIKQFLPAESEVATGTSDYVEFMKDRRTSYFYVEGNAALGSDVVIDIYFRTIDSSNGAGALLDVIRGVKIALDRKIGGPLASVSAFGFKNPPVHAPLEETQAWFDQFVSGSRAR
jgi:myo-inositol-1-phosphate synthase